MVTRTFRTSDGRANASVTVEGSPRHRIRVTINGEEVEFAAEDRTAPGDAAPSAGGGRAGGGRRRGGGVGAGDDRLVNLRNGLDARVQFHQGRAPRRLRWGFRGHAAEALKARRASRSAASPQGGQDGGGGGARTPVPVADLR